MVTKSLSKIAITLMMASVSQAGLREAIGRITGGLLGGALCNELGIGQGNGRTAAIALCAVGGSLIGGEIGREMDEADARAFGDYQRISFDGELNRDYNWDGSRYGSRTGIHGRLRPVNQGYHRQTREVCREYESTTYRGNRQSNNRSIVCRRSDGSFYSLEERTLYVNGEMVERRTSETRESGYRPVPRRPVPYPDNRGGDLRGRRYCSGWDRSSLYRGDSVVTRYGEMGTYQGRGRTPADVTVLVNGYPQRIDISEIAIQGCHFGISSGQRVSTRFGDFGVVAGIFQNGDVAVNMRGNMEIFRNTDISFNP